MEATLEKPATPTAAESVKGENIGLDQLVTLVAAKNRAKSSAPEPQATAPQQPEAATPETEAPSDPTPEATGEPLSDIQPEAEAVPDVETPAEETDDESETEPVDNHDPAKAIAKLQKRIHRQTAKYSAQIEALQAKLAETQRQEPKVESGPAPVVNGNEPFFWKPEVQQINGQLRQLESALAWAEANPDGGEVKDGEKTITLEPAQVRDLVSKATREISRLEARKATKVEHLQAVDATERQKATTEAQAVYPWMKTKTTPEYQEALKIIRENPGVTVMPDYLLLVGDLVAGRMARLNKGKATLKPAAAQKPGVKPPSIVTGPTSSSPRTDAVAQLRAEHAAAREEYQKVGNIDNHARLIAVTRRLEAALKAA